MNNIDRYIQGLQAFIVKFHITNTPPKTVERMYRNYLKAQARKDIGDTK